MDVFGQKLNQVCGEFMRDQLYGVRRDGHVLILSERENGTICWLLEDGCRPTVYNRKFEELVTMITGVEIHGGTRMTIEECRVELETCMTDSERRVG
jgi:hypothetical protein